ncbi:POC1 centriolar protein A [Ceratobasidium sp. UAMH 11750]|nr:POC1 centriolar protein A [Ceratobasidium sp. UAMH 11750]
MADSTPHIYVSMLLFWPKQGLVSKHYMRGTHSLVKVTGGGMRIRDWAPLAVLSSGSKIRDVAYSPDGGYIVSGSDDKTIRIWDAHTGQPVGQPLEGHTCRVNSVAYSPNGAYIVSGSGDETIRIWETRQAEMQEPVAEVSSTLSAPPPESENPLSHRAQHAPHISETATSRITECKSDEVGVLLDDWSLNEQGWVVNAKQDQLIWVPHELRDTRLRLRNNAVISHPGSIKLDFSDAKLGREWGRCFDPKRLLDVN